MILTNEPTIRPWVPGRAPLEEDRPKGRPQTWMPGFRPVPEGLPAWRPLPATPRRPTLPTPASRFPWRGSFRPGRQRRELRRRGATPRELAGLDGLGSWLKKQVKSINRIAAKPLGLISKQLEKNVVKIGDKLADNADSLHTKINKEAQRAGKNIQKFVKKNLKWIIIAAAIAITIYSMGSGASLAAKMLSGCKAIAAKVGTVFTGSAASGGAATAGATTAAAATTATTAAVSTTAATTAGLGTGFWATTAPLALQVGSKLLGGAKCSDLSQEERLAYGEAADAGLMPMNAELSHGLGLGGNPEFGDITGGGGGFPTEGFPSRGSRELPSWVMPAAIGAAALVLLVALKK